MTSIIKVDTIQTSAGGTPTAASLGIGGTIGQVVSTTKTDTFTTTLTSLTDVTGLSVSITPSSTSSKILVFGYLSGNSTAGSTNGHFSLIENSTQIAVGDASSNRRQETGMILVTAATDQVTNQFFSILRSPSTTSPLTYKVQVVCNGSGTIYVNRSLTDSDTSAYPRTASTITAMEVLA